MKRYCLALDLVNDAEKIQQYQQYHQKVWPEITTNICNRGVLDMQIWQVENRLFMIMETTDDYDADLAQSVAVSEPKNLEWETLMSQYQQVLPSAKPGEKWIEMEKIFDLKQ
ncbi:L-rhamnose mutarotase [uncultured Acinetobacter sp.]|uniref:L-rhamnose mutarotase n=1 Tax=uncultured Acinetobacter sp. TaxID=165433 RepID=UPI002585F7CF|nr:L-rhamnose mutarotase [uncultured Acinetobacter sp.]